MSKVERIKIIKRTRKYRHAIAFIQYLAGHDTEPTNGIKVLPFESVKQLYEEYQHYCHCPLNNKSKTTAGRAIFFEAFNGLKDTVKLAGVMKGKNISLTLRYLFDNRNF